MTSDTTPSDSQQVQQFFNWAKEKYKKQQHKSTISKYKRGLKWDQKQLNETETVENSVSEQIPKNTIIDIEEKRF
ncbi:MAG: hypothetical protein ACFE9L_03705 [Candidatus Hodarchaeota archaeon]